MLKLFAAAILFGRLKIPITTFIVSSVYKISKLVKLQFLKINLSQLAVSQLMLAQRRGLRKTCAHLLPFGFHQPRL